MIAIDEHNREQRADLDVILGPGKQRATEETERVRRELFGDDAAPQPGYGGE